jgi:hypothetical protein
MQKEHSTPLVLVVNLLLVELSRERSLVRDAANFPSLSQTDH